MSDERKDSTQAQQRTPSDFRGEFKQLAQQENKDTYAIGTYGQDSPRKVFSIVPTCGKRNLRISGPAEDNLSRGVAICAKLRKVADGESMAQMNILNRSFAVLRRSPAAPTAARQA